MSGFSFSSSLRTVLAVLGPHGAADCGWHEQPLGFELVAVPQPRDEAGVLQLADALLALCRRCQPLILVHNLLALETFHVAEAYGCASVAVSAFLPSFPPPDGFWPALCEAQPALAAAVERGEHGLDRGVLEAWLWRVLLDDQGQLRSHLGLSACAFVADAPDENEPGVLNLPAAPSKLFVSVSPAWGWKGLQTPTDAVIYTGAWHCQCNPSAASQDLQDSPTAKVLNGIASWRQRLTVEPFAASGAIAGAPSSSATQSKIVFLTWGSMERLNLVTPLAAQRMATRLGELVEEGQLFLALNVRVDGNFATMWRNTGQPLGAQQGCILVGEDLDHRAVFSAVDAVIHHGGAGTTATAAAVGVPQIICPFQFDQVGGGKMMVVGFSEKDNHPTHLFFAANL